MDWLGTWGVAMGAACLNGRCCDRRIQKLYLPSGCKYYDCGTVTTSATFPGARMRKSGLAQRLRRSGCG